MGDPRDQFQADLADRYTLERELGRGGMATVWLARDLKHERLVALKVLRADLSAILGGERFLREIRLTAALQHPHILPLLDSGEAAGVLYYVMPYVEGESLRQRLEREGQLSVEAALHLTRGVVAALEYAHRQGVIHRDVKPENILLFQGEPMVADFGIALAAASAGRERLTETGLSLGTPAYMSPEQASAEPRLDGRSDQYSLACVVYEMLAGEPPYTGSTAQAIIAKRLSEPVPRLGTLRQVPAGVEAAVTRGLAKRPADRYATVAEFATALERPAAPPKSFLTRRMAALFGGVAVLGVIALVAWLFRPAPPPRAMVTKQFTFTGKAGWPALSPDGKAVAYVSGNRALFVQALDGGEPLMLVPPGRYAGNPRWTADGRAIVVILMPDSTELAATYLVPAAGGRAKKVLEDMLLFDTGPESTSVVRIPRETHQLEVVDWRTDSVVHSIPLPDSLKDAGLPEWSPDRRLVKFEFGGVWVVHPGGGEPRRIVGGRNARWAPTSDALYYLDGPAGAEALFKIAVDTRTGAARPRPIRLQSLPGAGGFDVRGQRLVYTIAKTTQQARALTLGGQPRHAIDDRMLTEGTARVTGVTISPDGQSVAFSQARGDEANLFVVPFAGGSSRRITTPSGKIGGPAWAPDGSRLAFVRFDSTGPSAMLADLRSGALQRVGTLPGPASWWGDDYAVAFWAADGKHLAYLGRDLRQIALVDIERQSERGLPIPDSVGTGYMTVVPAPDGSALVVSTLVRPADWGELWWVSAQGDHWRKVRGPFGESWPVAWRPDGWLYVANHRVFNTDYGPLRKELWRMRGPEGTPELFAPLPDGCGLPDLSADGHRAVCVSTRTESDLYLSTDFDPDLR